VFLAELTSTPVRIALAQAARNYAIETPAPEYTPAFMSPGWTSSLKIATAAFACAEAAAIVYALATASIAKGHGVVLVDVLLAPLNFVIFAGPPLVVLGMASRARTAAATLVAAALVATFAWGLEAIRAAPWHSAFWHDHPEDAEVMFFLGVILAAWPLAALGFLVSRVLNRERDEEPR